MSVEEALKILEVSENASDQEVKEAFRKLGLRFHPDKEGSKEAFQKLVAARDCILAPENPEQSSEHDLQPEPWRTKEPASKEELCNWLQEDSEKYNVDIANDFPVTNSSHIYSNMWKLMQAKRLSYYDVQCMSPDDRKRFTQVILWDDDMTAQVIRGVKSGALNAKPYSVKELLEPSDSFLQVLGQLQRASVIKFNPAESFLLQIVMRSWEYAEPSQFQCATPNLGLLTGDYNRKLLLSFEVLGVWEELSYSIAALIRNYRSNTGSFTLEQLQPELKYRIQVVAKEKLNGFEELYNFAKVVQKLLEALEKEANKAPVKDSQEQQRKSKDDVSEVRQKELVELSKKLKVLACKQAKGSLDRPASIEQQQSEEAIDQYAAQRIELYKEAVSMISAALPIQAQHRRPVQAKVKFLVCWALLCVSFGVALIISDWVREGCQRKTTAQFKLTNSMEHFEKLCRSEEKEMSTDHHCPPVMAA